MRHILPIIISLLFCIGFVPSRAGDAEFLNEIAIRALNYRLSEDQLARWWEQDQDTLALKTLFVEDLMGHPEFIGQVVLVMRFQIMKGATHEDIYRQIEQFDVLSLMLPLDMDDAEEEAMYHSEKSRLQKVYVLTDDYLEGKINFKDIYMRMFDNYIYDIQNMGVENFIFSTFQYALGRKPTESEFRQGQAMYFNNTGYLFFKEGNSKDDYLNILTTSDNFLEYQVGYWYYYFLLQFPDLHEIHEILGALKAQHQTVAIEDIIKHILIHKI